MSTIVKGWDMTQYCEVVTNLFKNLPPSTQSLMNFFALVVIFLSGELVGKTLGKSLYFYFN